MPTLATSDGATIDYEIDGDGDPVLLLHGGFGSLRDWEDQARLLAQAGYRAIRPALRPHLGTSLPPGAANDLQRTSVDLCELLTSLDARRAHVAGWSYGGAVALRFAHDYPDLTRTLTLCNTFAAWRGSSLGLSLSLGMQRRLAAVAGKLPMSVQLASINASLKRFITPSTLKMSPGTANAYMESAPANYRLPDVRAAISSLYAYDARPWLPGLRMPVLVVTATRDHIPTQLSSDMASALPNATLERWEGTHAITWDDPDGFNKTFRRFVESADGMDIKEGLR